MFNFSRELGEILAMVSSYIVDFIGFSFFEVLCR